MKKTLKLLTILSISALTLALFLVPGVRNAVAQAVPLFYKSSNSNDIAVNGQYNLAIPMDTPILDQANATTTNGSLPTSTTWYIEVAAIDGAKNGGETIPSNELFDTVSSTTRGQLNLVWNQVPGAAGYKVYFSNTSGNEASYFLVAPTSTYSFATTTGSSSSTPLIFTDSYGIKLSRTSSKPSWILNGKFGVGTSTPQDAFDVVGNVGVVGNIVATNLPIAQVATTSFNQATFGTALLATSSQVLTVSFPFAGFAAGDPCIVGLTTAPSATAFIQTAQITTSSPTYATATVSQWSDATTQVTVATGTLKVECHH